jgi:ribosomal protein S4
MGIFRINGEVVYDPSFRLQPEQIIEFDWPKIEKIREMFFSMTWRYNVKNALRRSSLHFPANFQYCSKLRTATYLRLPRPGDLPENSRVNEKLFNWNQLDVGM